MRTTHYRSTSSIGVKAGERRTREKQPKRLAARCATRSEPVNMGRRLGHRAGLRHIVVLSGAVTRSVVNLVAARCAHVSPSQMINDEGGGEMPRVFLHSDQMRYPLSYAPALGILGLAPPPLPLGFFIFCACCTFASGPPRGWSGVSGSSSAESRCSGLTAALASPLEGVAREAQHLLADVALDAHVAAAIRRATALREAGGG